MPRTVKIAPEIDAKLYQELVSVAKENGQSQRLVLERALEHYLHNVVPSQRMVRRWRGSILRWLSISACTM